MPGQASLSRRLIRIALIGALFVLPTIVFFKPTVVDGATMSTVGAVQRVYLPWQVTHENGRPFFPQSDQAQSFYPRQVFVDRAVKDGKLPAWDPYTFAGHPYLSNGGNSYFYPPRQAVTRLAGPALAHDLYLMFHMAVAGCTAFALLRQLRFSTAGSLLGGLAWMWNPFALAWMQLELLPPIVAWLPLALALVHRADERSSWPSRLGAGGVCGLMLLGGSLDLALVATGLTSSYATALEVRRAWRDRHAPRRARRWSAGVMRLAAVPAMAIAIGAPALVPFLLLSARFARTPLDYETFTSSVTVPLRTFGDIWWRPDFPFTDVTMHRMAFVGTPIAILAVVGFVQRRPGTALARALLVGSILILGRTPLVALLDQLSSSYRFFSLGRFMYAWALGLIILAVAGFDRLASLLAGGSRNDPSGSVPDPLELTSPSAWRRPRRELMAVGFAVLAALSVSGQLYRYDRSINAAFTPRDRSWLFPETPAIEELLARRTAPASDRNLPIMRPGRQPLPDSSIPLVFPFESAAGYDSALPSTSAELWRVVTGEAATEVTERGLASGLATLFHTDRTRFDLLPRLGITSVIAPPDLEDESGWDEAGRLARGLRTVYDGPDADLLEVGDPAPRAYVVHRTELVGPGGSLERFTDPSFPWRTTVLLEQPRAPHDTASEPTDLTPATVTRHDLTEVRVDVTTDRAGHLVLLDTYDDGWTATVDGQRVDIARANSSFRAVEVPAGTSEVVFRYSTPGLRLGLALATLGLASGLGSLAWSRRGRRTDLSDG